jgi:hypothetical protein
METRRDVFQAIADPTRRAIIGIIVPQAMTPNAIAAKFVGRGLSFIYHSILKPKDGNIPSPS